MQPDPSGHPSPANDYGAPDERQHANYIGYVVKHHAYPVFKPGTPDLYETYQSHQPPLYYTLSAAWAIATGSADTANQSSKLPLRLFNCLIGAVAVLGVSRLALWGTKNETTALMATAFAALLPMNVALSGAISNDPLLVCLSSWVLALLAKMLRDGWSKKLGIVAAVLVGLALLTKTTALALLPVLLVGMALLPNETLKTRGVRALGLCALAVLIALPWLIRNQNLYGDPFAIKAFNAAFTGNPKASFFIEKMGAANYWRQDLYATMCSFFGVFGYWDVWMPSAVYNLMGVMLACFVVGWYLSLRPNPDQKQVHLVNGLFLFLIAALFIRFNMQYFQAQGRYIMPALGPIAVGIGCAVSYFSKKRALMVATVLATMMFGLNVVVLRWLPDQFGIRSAESGMSKVTESGEKASK